MTRDAAAMAPAPVCMPRPARPIAGPGMPEVPRSRRLEGQFHRCRRPEVAPPLLRQEVHLPQGHRPRALPNAAPRPGLLHQAHAPQHPRRVHGRAVRRHPYDSLRVATPRARHGIRLPGPDRAARHRLGRRDPRQRHRPLPKGCGQVRKRGLSRQKLCICVTIDIHKNLVASSAARETQLGVREEDHGR